MSITRINTNPDALAVQANLASLQTKITRTVSHLSTGLRIVTGADDPSGLALANKFRAQQGGLETAIGNVQDALTLFATADSALNDTQDILRRMRDLSVKSMNSAVLTAADQQALDNEYQALASEINRRSTAVTFNTKTLFDGTYAGVIQAGPNGGTQYQLSAVISAVTTAVLFAGGLGNITTQATASTALTAVQSALNIISNAQATIGVTEMKLNHVINDLQAQDVNTAAAKSRILDADMASEISDFTKLQILTQVGTAMLAQANAQPNTVLSLLGLK